jgi:hypothetical protein
MSSESPEPPLADLLRDQILREQQVPSARAGDAVKPLYVHPDTTSKPSDPPTEDDEIEAAFDNMPV